MALHRKQRGITDKAPQFVRIPTSRSSDRSIAFSVHEMHSRSHKRIVGGDQPRKISSLQLRACFVLCVLLYFGAIYFADEIAGIGRVVGSHQTGEIVFVQSLRPRGRGSRRERKSFERTDTDDNNLKGPIASSVAAITLREAESQPVKQDKSLLNEASVIAPPAKIITDETSKSVPAALRHQSEAQTEVLNSTLKTVNTAAKKSAVEVVSKGEDVYSSAAELGQPMKDPPIKRARPTLEHNFTLKQERDDRQQRGSLASAAVKLKLNTARAQPRLTAAVQYPKKMDGANVVFTSSLSHTKEEQHTRDTKSVEVEHSMPQVNQSYSPTVVKRLGRDHREPGPQRQHAGDSI